MKEETYKDDAVSKVNGDGWVGSCRDGLDPVESGKEARGRRKSASIRRRKE